MPYRTPIAALSVSLLLLFAAACGSSDPAPGDGAPARDAGSDGAPAGDTLSSDGPAGGDGVAPGERFAITFGATDALRVTAVSGNGAGGVVVVGSFGGTLNLGGGPLVSAGGRDIFVGAFDASGKHRLSFRLGSDGEDDALALAVGAAGEIHIGGSFEKSVSFGGAPLTSGGFTDAFVASFDAQGNPRWSARFGAEWTDAVHALAVAGSGLVAAGNFGAKAQLGATELDSRGDGDVVVAAFNDSGVVQWAKSMGSRLYDTAHGITPLADGGVAVIGEHRESVSFAGHDLTSAGDADAFVLALDQSGNLRWLKGLGGTGHDRGLAITTTPSGVVAAGGFDGPITLGATPLSPVGQRDVFVAALDATSGNVAWARSAGTAGDDEPASLAAAGNTVLVGGAAAGGLTLDSVVLSPGGKKDGFLFAIDEAGKASWGASLKSSEDDTVSALAQQNGFLLVSGQMGANLDADGELLVGPSAFNSYLLAYPLP